MFDTGVAQQCLELGLGDRLACQWIAHREPRIAVLTVDALADAWRVVGECQARVKRRAPRIGHAVDRPDATVLGEVGRARRVPVLGRDDECPVGAGRLDLAVIRGMMAAAPATLRLPGGSAKSFWTSTTINAEPGPYRCMD